MKKQSTFLKYSLHSISTNFIIFPVSFLSSVVGARILGPEGKGQLSLLLLVPLLATAMFRMGIGFSSGYFAGKVSKSLLIQTCFRVSWFLGLLSFPISLAVIYFFKGDFFEGFPESLVWCMTCMVPFSIFSNNLLGLLQGLYKIKTRNILVLCQAALNLCLLFLLIGVFDFGLHGAVVAWMVSLVLLVLLSYRFSANEIVDKNIPHDPAFLRSFLKFGAKVHIGNIFKELRYKGDLLLVGFFLDPTAVGFYVIGMYFAEILWKIPDAVGSVLLPHVASMEKSESIQFTPKVCRRVFLLMVCLTLATVVVHKPLILFAFGDQYLPSTTILLFLLPGITAFCVWKVLSNDIIARGFPKQYSISTGLSVLLMGGGGIFLIPTYGIQGAAVASSLSYILTTIYIMTVFVRVTGNPFTSLIVPTKSDFEFVKDFFANSLYNKFFKKT